MKKRSTFRRRRESHMSNAAYHAYRALAFAEKRARRIKHALTKPGARVARSEVVGAALSERARKGAKRAAAYASALAGYYRTARA